MQSPLARTLIPLDPQRVLRPRELPVHLAPSALTDWQAHLDARRIGATPPPAPHVIAIRDVNDALFRARAAAVRAAHQEDRA